MRVAPLNCFIAVVLVATLWVAPAAWAQQVYKCTDERGAVAYQQTPCSGPSQRQAVRDYAPGPPKQPAAAEAEPGLARDSDGPVGIPGDPAAPTPTPRTPAPAINPRARELDEQVRQAAFNASACGQARQEQQKLLARVGRTVSEMRSAEARVKQACRN